MKPLLCHCGSQLNCSVQIPTFTVPVSLNEDGWPTVNPEDLLSGASYYVKRISSAHCPACDKSYSHQDLVDLLDPDFRLIQPYQVGDRVTHKVGHTEIDLGTVTAVRWINGAWMVDTDQHTLRFSWWDRKTE